MVGVDHLRFALAFVYALDKLIARQSVPVITGCYVDRCTSNASEVQILKGCDHAPHPCVRLEVPNADRVVCCIRAAWNLERKAVVAVTEAEGAVGAS
jgi:hypothetical protein